MLKHLFTLVNLLVIVNVLCDAQKLSVTPANWWTQMNTNSLVLVVENAPIGITEVSVANSPLKILKHYPATNKSFHIVELEIPQEAKAHTATLLFKTTFKAPVSYSFPLYNRPDRSSSNKLSASDAIYQLIPDRFCNGNTKNDNIDSYFEKKDRLNPTGIHGGDIKGIISKLDYIKGLGCTALEIMPVTESNLMMNSYKRLAPTNFYKVDRRLGNLNLYKQLIDSCQLKGLKFIQTFTLHQVGNTHPYFQQMIDAEFFNGISYDFNSSSPDFNILTDPYSPESLKRANRQLWNKPNFPTLNQDKKLVRKILVQQLIWWIETTGLKNLKIEQAGRNNPELIKELYRHLSKDYSDLTVIIDNPSYNNQHFYWKNLTMEIPTYIVNYNYTQVLSNAFSPYEETKSSTKSLYNLQLQIEPSQLLSNINQLDNHLLNRAYTNADNDQTQLTMMLVHLMFTSGLPSIYYGTEWQLTGLLSKGISNLAKDFPGGWKNDETSGFSGKGMSEVQKQQYRLITKLLNWRKNNSDLFKGEFMHLILQNDVYAFIRQNNDQAILVIINNSNNSAYRLNEENYIGVFSQYSKFTEMLSDDVYLNFEDIVVREKSIAILTLDK